MYASHDWLMRTLNTSSHDAICTLYVILRLEVDVFGMSLGWYMLG